MTDGGTLVRMIAGVSAVTQTHVGCSRRNEEEADCYVDWTSAVRRTSECAAVLE